MEGIDIADLESYSGFITTNASTESNMFFWFFPATVSNGYFCCMYSIFWMLGLPRDVTRRWEMAVTNK